jgi:predicted phage replisome organizer
MGEVKWIKVSTEMFESNRKIKQIELMPEGDTILVIWLKLLLLAGNVNDGGAIYLTPEIPYTDEMLANELRRPITTVRMALSVFERFGMIEIIDDILHLSSWEKYQSADKLAELRAKDRDRKRLKRAQTKALLSVSTDVHGLSTDCPHIEEEGEKDLEKEFHSFNLSREEAKQKVLGGSLGGGAVMLSDEQFDDLMDKLSWDEINKYIAIVRDAELSGKHYKKKTHYQAILDMALKDRKVNGGK